MCCSPNGSCTYFAGYMLHLPRVSWFNTTAGCLTLQGPLRAGPKEMLSISPSCVRACTRAAALSVPLPDASKAAAAI